MLKELYIINQLEPGYEPNKIDERDSVKTLLQKIKMILFTRKGDILGDPNFGLSLEDLLFEFGFSANELKRKFDEQVAAYVTEAGYFDLKIEVNFVPGTVRDLAYIDIYVNGSKAFGLVAK
jgi:hypothetical protein